MRLPAAAAGLSAGGRGAQQQAEHAAAPPSLAAPARPQVCMMEGAKGVPDASYFLSSGCEPLRQGLGITGLLLPAVLPAHLAASEGGSIDLGNEIVWDDGDSAKQLTAAAFVNRMSVIRVRRRVDHELTMG
jgi:hypothetical protein